MNWQLLVAIYILLSVVQSLLTRSLASSAPQYNKAANLLFSLFHVPLNLVIASLIGFDLAIGWTNFMLIAAFSFIFPLGGLIGYRVSKDVDAGLNSILGTLNPIVSIVLAVLILSESFSFQQAIGVAVIMAGALMVTAPNYKRSSRNTQLGIWLKIFSIALVGVGSVYEVWIIDRIELGSYLVYGIILQGVWMVSLTWTERHSLKELLSSRYRNKALTLSLSRSVKGSCFLAALALSNSASIVGAYSSFIPVIVVIAAFVILKEKEGFWLKLSGGAIGTIGLVILSFA